MKTDIQIAQEATMLPITEIAKELGIKDEELEQYGRFKAKINDDFLKRTADKKDGKLVLVTARRRGQDHYVGGPWHGDEKNRQKRRHCHS